MIALEFIGTITEDAKVGISADNKKEIMFPVDVKRGIDKNGLDKSMVIYCKKKGECSSDKRLVSGQKNLYSWRCKRCYEESMHRS